MQERVPLTREEARPQRPLALLPVVVGAGVELRRRGLARAQLHCEHEQHVGAPAGEGTHAVRPVVVRERFGESEVEIRCCGIQPRGQVAQQVASSDLWQPVGAAWAMCPAMSRLRIHGAPIQMPVARACFHPLQGGFEDLVHEGH
eukprot:10757793-Lingulodinium_polyedra.AAC.1